MPDGRTWTRKSTSSNKNYTIWLRPTDNRLSCECRGWIIAKPGRPRSCVHTDEIEGLLKAEGYAMEIRGDAKHFILGKKPTLTMTSTNTGDNGNNVKITILPGATGTNTTVNLPAVSTSTEIPYVLPTPMLAAKAPEGTAFKDYENADWAMEEKFDGVRVLIIRDKQDLHVVGRPQAGKNQGASRELHYKLKQDLLLALPSGIFDGELFLPGGRSTDVVTAEAFDNLRVVLYDVLEFKGQSVTQKSYTERRVLLNTVMAGIDSKWFYVAASFEPSEEHMKALVSIGAEGVMLKRRASTYQPGQRSQDWIKFKKHEEGVFVIIGFKAGKQGPHSIVLMARQSDGKKVQAKILNADWIRRCVYGSIHEGTMVEVEYQEEMAEGFRHPQIKRVVGED